MPTVTAPPGRWEALGGLLKRRRTQLSPRYRARSAFARATEVNDRMLADLEEARRTTYRDTSLRAVETAYRLTEGAIERFVSSEDDHLDTAEPDDPVAGASSEWDERIAGPDGALEEDEVLLWRTEGDDVTYRLYRSDDRLSTEAVIPANEELDQVIEDMRELLEAHRSQVQLIERRRKRRLKP